MTKLIAEDAINTPTPDGYAQLVVNLDLLQRLPREHF